MPGLLCRQIRSISIHAPHTGRDHAPQTSIQNSEPFQSTRPIRGATSPQTQIRLSCPDFNPRAPYGARLPPSTAARRSERISIHAPHTGRDHAPQTSIQNSEPFQSTRPIRGATSPQTQIRLSCPDFNPRAPYGARLPPSTAARRSERISIHAPHTGRDDNGTVIEPEFKAFQSTRPIRGATLRGNASHRLNVNFNPRAPYGARLAGVSRARLRSTFQSTRPIRGATRCADKAGGR